MTKFATLDDAIRLYEDSEYKTASFVTSAIKSILEKSVNGVNPMTDLIDTSDLILKQLADEGYEDELWHDVIYRFLYSHVTTKSLNSYNNIPIIELYRTMIDIRMVLSYAESNVHVNRYRLRDKNIKNLWYNYYSIENKVFSYLSKYGDKIRNIITNRMMVTVYNLKLISKYHCNMDYSFIESVVKCFGEERYY